MTKSLTIPRLATEEPQPAAILLLKTIADTTWRVFAPMIGGTFVGIYLDHLFDTIPWWTVGMIFAGCLVSAVLIKLQLRSVRK